MKHIDDVKIVKKLNSLDDYEIKTTSNDILLAFEKEKETSPVVIKEEKKKFNLPLFFKISIPTLVGACVLALIVVPLINLNQNIPPHPGDNLSILNLSEKQQKIIGKELNTLASFESTLKETSSTSSLTLINSMTTFKRNDNKYNQRVDINHVIDLYDPYSYAVINLVNNKDFKIDNLTIENEAYSNILTLTNANQVVKVEYNIAIETSNDEFLMEGNLINENNVYPITIYTENEKNETEVTTIIEFAKNTVIKIEQENESENFESETSISYATYSSIEDAKSNKERFIEKFTYEYESEIENGSSEIEMEVEIENKDNEELSLEVMNHTDSSVMFRFEYEGEENEIENQNLECILNEDGSRSYYYNNEEPIIRG